MKRFLIVAGVLAPLLVLACYNDRDTLGFELYNKPDVQKALTGRFDRFPALYYTMRVNRLRAKAKLNPNEYDDMAVALGRLSRNDEALAALALKAKLPNLSKMDEYRLYANRGTIEAHRWIHDGAKVASISELKTAANDIAKALSLNPNAHFGREGTQLEVIRWIIQIKTAGKNAEVMTLGEWLYEKLEKEKDRQYDYGTTLAGLIMLGGAWESPDVALAIGQYGQFHHHEMELAQLALMRYQELIGLGRKPLSAQLADDMVDEINAEIPKATRYRELPTSERFKMLRKEAEAWHDQKTRYMLTRLEKGQHPDTDPAFWSEWKEPPMPVIPTKLPSQFDWHNLWIFAGLMAALFVVGYTLLRLKDTIRRRLQPPQVG